MKNRNTNAPTLHFQISTNENLALHTTLSNKADKGKTCPYFGGENLSTIHYLYNTLPIISPSRFLRIFWSTDRQHHRTRKINHHKNHNITDMLIYRPQNRIFKTRKELKDYLGGTNRYNKALKDGLIHNLYIAHNDTIHNDTERHSDA